MDLFVSGIVGMHDFYDIPDVRQVLRKWVSAKDWNRFGGLQPPH